jgi:AraC-like DNA-binding protein
MKEYISSKKAVNADLLLQLTRAKNFIDQDVSRKVDIDMLAKEASLSKFHFFRCFKNAFGLSPYQYLLKKRLEKSMELLSKGNCQVTEVAYEVGFSDVYSFSKSFKKYFNACPSQVIIYCRVDY